jgi:hypothetical protein
VNTETFGMHRLTKSKKTVDLAPNTIREYARQGLPLYRMGRAVFFNVAELEHFIRSKGSPNTVPGAVKIRSLPQS